MVCTYSIWVPKIDALLLVMSDLKSNIIRAIETLMLSYTTSVAASLAIEAMKDEAEPVANTPGAVFAFKEMILARINERQDKPLDMDKRVDQLAATCLSTAATKANVVADSFMEMPLRLRCKGRAVCMNAIMQGLLQIIGDAYDIDKICESDCFAKACLDLSDLLMVDEVPTESVAQNQDVPTETMKGLSLEDVSNGAMA